jgi:hypothetical protein
MERYSIAEIRRTETGKRYYDTTLPPTITKNVNDIYIITGYGDRLDLIAYDYYGDASQWWIIASANPNAFHYNGSLVIEPGIQLRIPQSALAAESEYESQNSTR